MHSYRLMMTDTYYLAATVMAQFVYLKRSMLYLCNPRCGLFSDFILLLSLYYTRHCDYDYLLEIVSV